MTDFKQNSDLDFLITNVHLFLSVLNVDQSAGVFENLACAHYLFLKLINSERLSENQGLSLPLTLKWDNENMFIRVGLKYLFKIK